MSQEQSAPILRAAGEGVLRLLFGIVMAVIAVALTFGKPSWFAAVTAVMMMLAGREWHRMVRSEAQREAADQMPVHIQTAITAATIALSLAALLLNQVALAFVLLALGVAAGTFQAQQRGDNPLWHGGGVLYVGLPGLALVGLKTLAPQGPQTVLGLFLIVWATDTGALVFGKLIGGPKLAPRISPGKTWTGTLGGSITAAMVFGLYIAFFSFNVPLAMLFALVFSLVAHGGDLFESLVKRHFGTKDSGGLIPGHGGALDRMDSMFAASLVMALLVFGLHFNPLFGGRA